MQIKTFLSTGIAASALALSLTACGSGSSSGSAAPSTSASTASTAAAAVMSTFSGLNGKKVAGDVSIDGSTVTLSGFSSDEGPDLHLWLTNGTTEADVTAGVEISKVAYNEDSQTFTLDSGLDATKYTDLVVHCDKAKAVFGAAGLS